MSTCSITAPACSESLADATQGHLLIAHRRWHPMLHPAALNKRLLSLRVSMCVGSLSTNLLCVGDSSDRSPKDLRIKSNQMGIKSHVRRLFLLSSRLHLNTLKHCAHALSDSTTPWRGCFYAEKLSKTNLYSTSQSYQACGSLIPNSFPPDPIKPQPIIAQDKSMCLSFTPKSLSPSQEDIMSMNDFEKVRTQCHQEYLNSFDHVGLTWDRICGNTL